MFRANKLLGLSLRISLFTSPASLDIFTIRLGERTALATALDVTASPRARWEQNHPNNRHSTHPSPLAFVAVLILGRSFFIPRFPFAPLSARMSSHQQDLPSTALFRGGLSFDCVAEWQLAADRDHKFASRAASAMNSRIFVRCREHLHYLRRLRQALSGRTVENCISALANLVDEYRKARCVARQSVFPSLRQQKAVE